MPPCVLVAEHDPIARATVQRPLVQAGYRVVAGVPDQI